MEMPKLEDIFLNMGLEKFSSPLLEDAERAMRGYLEKLVEKKEMDNSAAERLIDSEMEICLSAKCDGFVQGFRFAVRLLLN